MSGGYGGYGDGGGFGLGQGVEVVTGTYTTPILIREEPVAEKPKTYAQRISDLARVYKAFGIMRRFGEVLARYPDVPSPSNTRMIVHRDQCIRDLIPPEDCLRRFESWVQSKSPAHRPSPSAPPPRPSPAIAPEGPRYVTLPAERPEAVPTAPVARAVESVNGAPAVVRRIITEAAGALMPQEAGGPKEEAPVADEPEERKGIPWWVWALGAYLILK